MRGDIVGVVLLFWGEIERLLPLVGRPPELGERGGFDFSPFIGDFDLLRMRGDLDLLRMTGDFGGLLALVGEVLGFFWLLVGGASIPRSFCRDLDLLFVLVVVVLVLDPERVREGVRGGVRMVVRRVVPWLVPTSPSIAAILSPRGPLGVSSSSLSSLSPSSRVLLSKFIDLVSES